jgi:cob(I)alamin adenosyltransferase
MKPNIGSGDAGDTSILGGRRVPKTSAIVEALGAIDEASAAVGLARSLLDDARGREFLQGCQVALQKVAAEIASAGRGRATDFDFHSAITTLETEMQRVAADVRRPNGFLTPGDTPAQAALNLARAVVRRAERRAVAVRSSGAAFEPAAAVYLNRLSDLLFDMLCATAGTK